MKRFFLEEKEKVSKNGFYGSLEFQGENCESEDDTKEDEQKDLHYHAQVKG